MNKSDKITLELAEKICKRKFEQTFGELDDKFYLDENNMEEFLKKQIQLWKEVGATHLSEHSLVILPPIKNKSIKFDEALEERSFEKMKVSPLTSIKNKSIKNVDSKKFNIVGEINTKMPFPEMFQKS
jgi:hypothetical protein